MLSLISTVLYLTMIPAGLVLGSTPERLALLLVAAVLLLRLAVRRRTADVVPLPGTLELRGQGPGVDAVGTPVS